MDAIYQVLNNKLTDSSTFSTVQRIFGGNKISGSCWLESSIYKKKDDSLSFQILLNA